MWAITKQTVMLIMISAVVLTGCNQKDEPKVVIKPAPKLTKDATQYAKESWGLMTSLDEKLLDGSFKQNQIDDEVRKPLRELGNRWMINVKMGDSVAEGNFALCRKAMVSLDSVARAIQAQENPSILENTKKTYLRDKTVCKSALDNPELGNSKDL
ncbi:hypothetical protein I2F27_03470 [Acinetobacter sp. B5B]|uniref:hypothetical protein n=1 Tax=Acinetobacter baretiae TaxID=2605383 RepID=UPI0018C2DE69|nr:hypothetical protein [Acinetobacter baretiae]MBF7682390.1 hypothetical protein [Acinetobacter baretiae]